MANVLSPRDYLRIQEAAEILGVSEQTLRNWDRSGKLRVHRHPINGYRLYRATDLHALLRKLRQGDEGSGDADPRGSQLSLDLAGVAPEWEVNERTYSEPTSAPPCHWRAEVALDPKHRPQRWDGQF